MKKYTEMTKDELLQEKTALEAEYEKIKGLGLSLDMSRGKPGADQLDLSLPMLDVLKSDSEMKSESGLDVRNGMTAIVAIKHPEPRFEGQTKTKLDNPDAGTVVSSITNDEVQMYFDRNLEQLKAVIACAEKSAKIRKAEEKAKTNLLSKPKFSIDSNGKLANC